MQVGPTLTHGKFLVQSCGPEEQRTRSNLRGKVSKVLTNSILGFSGTRGGPVGTLSMRRTEPKVANPRDRIDGHNNSRESIPIQEPEVSQVRNCAQNIPSTGGWMSSMLMFPDEQSSQAEFEEEIPRISAQTKCKENRSRDSSWRTEIPANGQSP